MIIDPNNRVFDRVPGIFLSPYPADEAQANAAFDTLLERAKGGGQTTVGEDLLSQAGAEAWNQATQLLWKKKATLSGDVLGEVWGKVAWINPKSDSIAGLLAEVPFGLTSDPTALLGAMASVAIDLALNAVSAIPVAGWIIGIVVGIGKALASVFKGLATSDPVEERSKLPWGRYNRDVDQEWVRTFINIDGPGVDWTPMFAPPTKATAWSLLDGVEKDGKTVLGQVLAPFTNKTVAYNGMYGCIPGTFRVAGLLQYRGRPQGAAASLRFYNDATLIHRYGDFTQTGDFFPALQQLAGATWQQVAAGGPDAYKVDCAKLESMWRDWFTALYTSAMEQGHGDYLLPYLAREVHGEWRLGANASGIIRPDAIDGTAVPLVTDGTFKTGALATAASRTPCMFTEGEVKGVRVDGNDLARKWLRDAKTGVYTAPPPSPYMNDKGRFCVPWPPGDLLLSKYRRADDAIITPAVRAVAQLQRRRLSRSLDCAYVRPEAVDGRPAYAAFAGPGNAALRDYCIEMRKRLLTHPDRMKVEYETVREVDREYADALRTSGVPTTALQRAAAMSKLGGNPKATGQPLDPKQPAPARPLPAQGGLAFDPNPETTPRGPTWVKPAIYGGAALVSSIALALGIKHVRAQGG